MRPRPWIFAFLAGLAAPGCSPTQPVVASRERYFQPVIRRVQPLAPSALSAPAATAASTREANETTRVLEGALAESRREVLYLRMELSALRDSVRWISEVVRQQRQASLALSDRVSAVEGRSAAPATTGAPPPLAAAPKPSSVVPGRSTTPSSRQGPAPVRVRSQSDYDEGVQLFRRKQYDAARQWFSRLLEEGIVEDLADNCEYWVGECDFARGQWTAAVRSFERVLALSGSNKHADALLMLGRTYEAMRQTDRARSAYERLVREYPSSQAATTGRWKLRSLPTKPTDRSDERVLS